MNKQEQMLGRLREAVRQSPENVPLRQHLAETLLGSGFAAEAQQEFEVALAQEPRSGDVKLGLAQAMYQQGKQSAARLVIEELMSDCDPPPAAYVLHATVLLDVGERRNAIEQYELAVSADPGVADEALAERLGILARKIRLDGEPVGVEDTTGGNPLPGGEMRRSTVTFEQVGGMDSVKEEIRLKIIYPMTHRDLFEEYGQAIGGGILLYGPPGCGKTLIARATAGEIDAPFLAVGINEILDMWMGNSEKNLHDVFERARRQAPSVLFFDEMDALGARRGSVQHSAIRNSINQFLGELDGARASNEGVLTLAATNAPWDVDSAFRRPGRFDRVVFVPPPDETARTAILNVLLQGKPVDRIDAVAVARATHHHSGADLKAVVETAVRGKLQQALKTGRKEPLTTKDLLRAAAEHKPTTAEWLRAAQNYVRYANQGGEYDEIRHYLGGR